MNRWGMRHITGDKVGVSASWEQGREEGSLQGLPRPLHRLNMTRTTPASRPMSRTNHLGPYTDQPPRTLHPHEAAGEEARRLGRPGGHRGLGAPPHGHHQGRHGGAPCVVNEPGIPGRFPQGLFPMGLGAGSSSKVPSLQHGSLRGAGSGRGVQRTGVGVAVDGVAAKGGRAMDGVWGVLWALALVGSSDRPGLQHGLGVVPLSQH